jgi:predicted XRE-type DNA-binding protein
MSDENTIHDSSGNVFADLQLPDADERLAKAELARVIRQTLAARNLTQQAAAAVMGLTQPEVSDLVRGRLARFGMERLERCLNRLDMDIRIQVVPKPVGKARAGITVEYVSG